MSVPDDAGRYLDYGYESNQSYDHCCILALVLANSPLRFTWFALHPLLQTLAIALFTYGQAFGFRCQSNRFQASSPFNLPASQ